MHTEAMHSSPVRRLRIPPPWDLRLVALLGLMALGAYLLAFTHVLGQQPVNGTYVGTMFIAGVQSAVCVMVATLLMPRRRNRLYAWMVLWLMVALTTVSVSAALVGPSSGYSSVIRSPLFFLAVLALVLFDTGRPSQRLDRLVTIPASALAVIAFIGVVLTSPALPGGAIGFDCAATCAPHGWNAIDAPALSEALRGLYLLFRSVALAACAVTLVMRYRPMRGAMRSMFRPLAWIGVMYMLAGLAGTAVQAFHLSGEAAAAVAPFLFFTRIAIPLAIGAGVIIGEQRRGGSLDSDFSAIRAASTPGEVQGQLRTLLEDPSLTVVVPGTEVPVDDLEVTELRGPDGHLVASVCHRPGLEADQPVGFNIAIPAASLALRQMELEGQMADLRDLLADAKRQAVTAGDDERRRIEQDLHDGAQLRVIMLRGRIEQLASRTPGDEAGRRDIDAMLDEADALLGDIRGMTSGMRRVAPGQLRAALTDLAGAAPLATRLQVGALGEVAPAVEQAVFYCVSEAVQNAAKHGGSRASVVIDVAREGDDLVFRVSDDGAGLPADVQPGRGVSGMEARLEALGGVLSPPAPLPFGGATVQGRVPATAAAKRTAGGPAAG